MAEGGLMGESIVPPSSPVLAEDKTPVFIAYGCLALGWFLFPLVAPLVGVILAYVKRGEHAPLLRAHDEWIIETFWVTLVLGIVGGLLVLVMIGWLILIPLWIWYIYRVVRGLVRLSEGRPPRG